MKAIECNHVCRCCMSVGHQHMSDTQTCLQPEVSVRHKYHTIIKSQKNLQPMWHIYDRFCNEI